MRAKTWYKRIIRCAIIDLVKGQYLVLTDDFRLSNYLGKQGIDVLNFNHLRFASWR